MNILKTLKPCNYKENWDFGCSRPTDFFMKDLAKLDKMRHNGEKKRCKYSCCTIPMRN